MNIARVLLVVAVGLVMQMALARYAVGGRWAFDLVLVAVVYAGLAWGPIAGMWAGTAGGLIQDALSGDVIGVGGLAKTIAGLGAGVAGSQFVVSQASSRVATVVVVTVGHRLLLVSLLAIVDQRWSDISWTAMLVEIGVNGLAGLIAFKATELAPGAVRQSRRSSLSKRRW
ncbi:MAG: rod shape-determining protein MreD [Acidobacteria bacterium]|nr:rod shape-determining protein MreD [Acidobacteriota bacterium]